MVHVAHLLIVDDDLAVSQTFARMLAHVGYRVTTAPSADAALKLTTQDPPDAIIVDMRMPDVTGLEFLRLVRQDARLRETPVGLVTGDYFLNEQVLNEISALGATVRYKPLWLEDLSSLARTLVAPAP